MTYQNDEFRKSPKRRSRRLAAGLLGLLAVGGVAFGAAHLSANANDSSSTSQKPPVSEKALSAATDLSSAFRSVARSVLPAVVAIENRPEVVTTEDSGRGPSADPFGGRNPFEGTPFEEFFNDPRFRGRQFEMPRGRGRPAPRAGIGSGVIIDKSGVILTNHHVIAGNGTVTVRTHDGRTFEASQVWSDPHTDVAVVKIDGASDLVAAPLADSEKVEIGDWVLALGQPFGLESTVTAGIISAKHRGLGIADRENFLQTDAAINPGNSGGPLVNLKGEIVGINTAIRSRSGGNDGIGFAVPANMANWVSDQLLEHGEVKRAYLGVGIQPLNPQVAKQLGVESRQGVVVTNVFEGTPAEKSGLKSGDVITHFGGEKVGTPSQLQLLVERSEVGDTATVKVIRDGETVELTYEAASRPGDFGRRTPGRSGDDDGGRQMPNFGLEVSPLSDQLAEQLGMEGIEGVVVTDVAAGSAAAQAGLQPGLVITQADRKQVSSVEELEAVIAEADNDVLLLVRSETGSRFVVVERE